jgi:hypothetical protein
LAFSYETSNNLYGRTLNAHDYSRSAGGSSGGEGAIIAAKGSPLGIGTDLAGSIRIPTHFNGICGLKGTKGMVPVTNWYYLGEGILYEEVEPILCEMAFTGPMSRYPLFEFSYRNFLTAAHMLRTWSLLILSLAEPTSRIPLVL